MRTLITGGTIVNEGRTFPGSVLIEDGNIVEILDPPSSFLCPDSCVPSAASGQSSDVSFQQIDATGCFVLPGIIDSHVHFREPGLTEKADIDTESRAAAAGGITSFFDMPNTVPQTTTLEALDEKFSIAAAKSHVNYSFFFGATNDNSNLYSKLDTRRVPGIKLFMGSSTGNMLVDSQESLEHIFATSPLPLMAHCEDTAIINRNMSLAKEKYGDDPSVEHHPEIRSEEACYESSRLAVDLATKHRARLHIAHISTARELELLTPYSTIHTPHSSSITAEATVSHLYFCDRDYRLSGTRIKCNPAIKTEHDREALQLALTDGRITTIGTDHAPHLLQQKEGGCASAASGMPMIQFSLVTMLEMVDHGVLTLERLVELMAHNPARIFNVVQRGFLRPGYRADITIVRPHAGWTVSRDSIISKCGWSPMEGHTYLWRVERTMCNGHTVYQYGQGVDTSYIGEEIRFNH